MAPKSSKKVFSWSEIARISADETNEQQLTVIHGKVYDIGGDFATAFHPGGRVALSQVGYDATGAFEEFHQATAHEILANFYVGDLERDDDHMEQVTYIILTGMFNIITHSCLKKV